MTHHDESGKCPKCAEILDLYPGFDDTLRTWFEALQIENPTWHASCGGRGKVEQEALFQRGATRAHYGHSAHNYNLALDLFQQINGEALWSKDAFNAVIAPLIYGALNWYGAPSSPFFELPHVELKYWEDLVSQGRAKLVE